MARDDIGVGLRVGCGDDDQDGDNVWKANGDGYATAGPFRRNGSVV